MDSMIPCHRVSYYKNNYLLAKGKILDTHHSSYSPCFIITWRKKIRSAYLSNINYKITSKIVISRHSM